LGVIIRENIVHCTALIEPLTTPLPLDCILPWFAGRAWAQGWP
jgi:hypothetical protein